ncbi:valyl-tRNA synthetase [Paenibacillus sp. JCM 10914]|nr:valyl-tRNA synthetase [Paenibacillus sp. JCM 10914]
MEQEQKQTQSLQMPTTYDPKAAEQKWYPYWKEGGFLKQAKGRMRSLIQS